MSELVQCTPGCELCRQWAMRGAHEIVICAAVQLPDGRVLRCHRHDDMLGRTGWYGAAWNECEQGFVTSRNRYVGREEALRIQRMAGIESVAPGGYRGPDLFSEDLY